MTSRPAVTMVASVARTFCAASVALRKSRPAFRRANFGSSKYRPQMSRPASMSAGSVVVERVDH